MLPLIYPILGDPVADCGGKGKSKRAKENGDKEKPTMLFFVDILFCPFRLPLASAICPWVSEDGSIRNCRLI